jgi:hypothetical protein
MLMSGLGREIRAPHVVRVFSEISFRRAAQFNLGTVNVTYASTYAPLWSCSVVFGFEQSPEGLLPTDGVGARQWDDWLNWLSMREQGYASERTQEASWNYIRFEA